MNELLKRVMQYSIVDNDGELIAANILESELWETIVYAVCKWIIEIAEENWESITDTIEEIIEEHEDVLDE